MNQLDNAESFIKAAALKDNDTLSLNALGYVYSQKENNFKAAAYEMVLGRDSIIFTNPNWVFSKLILKNTCKPLIILSAQQYYPLKTMNIDTI